MFVHTRVMQILVAGPLRGGTGDDPDLIHANLEAMTSAALELYRRGHMPIVGEWLSLPLIEAAGSERIGDAIYDEIQHPLGQRLLEHSDGCLRIGGESSGADLMVSTTQELGKPVWFDLEAIPAA